MSDLRRGDSDRKGDESRPKANAHRHDPSDRLVFGVPADDAADEGLLRRWRPGTSDRPSPLACSKSPSGEHEWVDDERLGEGECLWCMARCTIGRFGRAPKTPNLRGRGA